MLVGSGKGVIKLQSILQIELNNKSDIILLGVSRTSKTPTSIYLANKGFKTSNIPLINENSIPEFLKKKPQTESFRYLCGCFYSSFCIAHHPNTTLAPPHEDTPFPICDITHRPSPIAPTINNDKREYFYETMISIIYSPP